MEVYQDVKHAQLVAGVRPQLGQDPRVEVRPVGHHHLGRKPPGLEVLEEPPHVGLVVAGDQGEGHRQVVQRVGRQQQGHLAQVQLVDAERPAEVVQDPAAVIRQVEPPDLPVEAVVDEPVREIQEGSGTGPILLSQAAFLLAHIANNGPVPLYPPQSSHHACFRARSK